MSTTSDRACPIMIASGFPALESVFRQRFDESRSVVMPAGLPFDRGELGVGSAVVDDPRHQGARISVFETSVDEPPLPDASPPVAVPAA